MHRPRTQATAVPFTPRQWNPASPTPLYRQLYEALRAAILSGQLRSGSRLPATRILATELGLSRSTVITAVEQLLAEGYVEGKPGSGTYVAQVLPDAVLQVGQVPASPVQPEIHDRALSRRGQLLTGTRLTTSDTSGAGPFRTGTPALDAFPWKTWTALEARCLGEIARALGTYGHPAGYRPLRQAIADYLGMARAVRCTADQVTVVSGSQQALDLVGRILLDPGDAVWVEEPGYLGARGALMAAGARLIPVPVDADGMDVGAGVLRCPAARLVYVTPSHQYPLGVTLSLGRRLALLDWARRAQAWVLEDDHDSEYRYVGRPLASLQGLDEDERVLYTGSFSKVLFPALRLGYLVVPDDLVDAFTQARALADRGSPLLEQAVVARFLADGHFGRHIRQMRTLYAERQATLVREAQRYLEGAVEVHSAETGLHVVGHLPATRDDRQASAAALHQGVYAAPLSAYALEPLPLQGLVLGYAGCDERQIQEGVARLATALAG